MKGRLLAALAAAMVAAGPVAAVPKGMGGIQAAVPGAARCLPTSARENAAAAAATSRTRSYRGLPPVAANARLAQVAADHACDMALRGTMTHRGSRTSGPAQRVKARGYRPSVTAENIAAGPFGLEGVLQAWNGSPGHLGNIMIPQLRDYGIGRAIGADGKTVFWAAVYAAPRR